MEHAHFSQTRCAQDKFRESRSRVWQLHLAVASGGAAVGGVCVRVCVGSHDHAPVHVERAPFTAVHMLSVCTVAESYL